MNYLDTEASYAEHRQRVDYSTLIRNYVSGTPYGDPRDPTNEQNLLLWQRLMRPQVSQDKTAPIYLRNLAYDSLSVLVQDVLPSNSKLDLNDGGKLDVNQLLKDRFDFGVNFGTGLRGFRDWVKSVLFDVAQAGRGIIVLRMYPAEGGSPPRIGLDYYPGEVWRRETDPATGRVLFDRIEYKYDVPGDTFGKAKVKWHREDIYPDRVVRYAPADAMPYGEIPPLHGWNIMPVLDIVGLERAPSALSPEQANTIRGWIEAETIRKAAPRGIVFPIHWKRLNHGGAGNPEIMHHQANDLDLMNQMLSAYVSAVHEAGSPPLTFVDVSFPIDKTAAPAAGELNTKPAAGYDQQRAARSVVGAGAVNVVTSAGTGKPWVGYPNNPVKDFPHDDAANALKMSFMGISLSSLLSPSEISHFGQMTGFMAQVMRHDHDQMIDWQRDRALGPIEDAMLTAFKMLAFTGASKYADLRPEFKFGKAEKTSDEKQKDVTNFVMLLKNGVDPEELIDLLPVEVKDKARLIADLRRIFAVPDPLQEQIRLAEAGGAEVSVAAKLQPEAEAVAGVDNKAK